MFVLLWATGFVGARAGMPHAEPGTFLAIRFVIAFVLLAAIAVAFGAVWPRGRAAGSALAVGVLVHGVYLGGVFWAVRNGMPAGVAAVVVGLQPLFTALLAGWWLEEPITQRHRIGLGLGLAGVVLVLAPKLDVTGSGITTATIAATVAGCLAVTVGTVLQKATGAASDLRAGTALQYLGALVPVSILMAFETREVAWTGELVFALAWLVLVLSLAAVFLLMWLIREGSVAKVSALFFLVPAVAAVMAWALFGETLGGWQILGMGLSAVAVWLATGGAGARPPKTRPPKMRPPKTRPAKTKTA